MRAALAAPVALALALAACAKPLDQLEPYPCPTDYPACPDGRTCVDGVGCVKPYVDGPCNQFSVDCSLASPSAACLGGACDFSTLVPQCEVGACEEPCSAGACAAGRVCTGTTDGACVPDCGAGQACPDGLVCQRLPTGGHGCVPASADLPTCTSVEVLGSCQQCGMAFFDVPCPMGGTCARHSTCEAGNTCTCEAGLFVYNCDDQPCTGGTSCPYPNWYCRPEIASTTPGCADTTFLTQGTCHCADGHTVLYGCGEVASCNERCAE